MVMTPRAPDWDQIGLMELSKSWASVLAVLEGSTWSRARVSSHPPSAAPQQQQRSSGGQEAGILIFWRGDLSSLTSHLQPSSGPASERCCRETRYLHSRCQVSFSFSLFYTAIIGPSQQKFEQTSETLLNEGIRLCSVQSSSSTLEHGCRSEMSWH